MGSGRRNYKSSLKHMDISDLYKRVDILKEKFLEIRQLAQIQPHLFEPDEQTGMPLLLGGDDMAEVDPLTNQKLHERWNEIQKLMPPGFDVDGNLIRHLSFNEAHDWVDISNRDVARELVKIEEFRRRIVLIEHLNTLYPDVTRAADVVMNGDFDAGLKFVYAALDTKMRQIIKAASTESTVPAIGKAFKEGVLCAPQAANNDSARNFLQGVVGYYRSNIVHSPLPQSRNSIDASLPLFALASEAFKLLDACSRQRN